MKQKTKKIVLLITSVLTLLINLGYAYGINIGAINLEVVGENTEIAINAQLTLLYICASINLIAIFFISKGLIVHKKILIALNVIQFLIGTIFNIFGAIINIFILSSCLDILLVLESKYQ